MALLTRGQRVLASVPGPEVHAPQDGLGVGSLSRGEVLTVLFPQGRAGFAGFPLITSGGGGGWGLLALWVGEAHEAEELKQEPPSGQGSQAGVWGWAVGPGPEQGRSGQPSVSPHRDQPGQRETWAPKASRASRDPR